MSYSDIYYLLWECVPINTIWAKNTQIYKDFTAFNHIQ